MTSTEKELLYKITREWGLKAINGKKLERVGKSGSKLFLISKKKSTLPFVFKVNRRKKIKEEYKGIKSIQPLLTDTLSVLGPKYSPRKGALLYQYKGAETTKETKFTKELEEIVYNMKYPTGKLLSHFDKLFQKIKKLHNDATIKTFNLFDNYGRYFRDHVARKRIYSVLGHCRKYEFQFLRAKILHPIVALSRLQRESRCKIGAVHGDLHPRNIILDRKHQLYLIDFAWSHRARHILIDYVLLENSLRFFLFPKFVNLNEQLEVDKLLLDEKGYIKIKKIFYTTRAKRKAYERLAVLVGTIRRWARKDVGEKYYSFNNYLLSQFIVLYGLLKFEEYDIYIALRALGLIADRLLKNGLLTES